MDVVQPWATGFNRPKPLPSQMSIQRSQTSPLSREEKLEARRLAEESNFSYAGYQVVRREFVSHRFDPAMTVRVGSITFNNACIKALENATYVQFLINPTEKKLIVRPCEIGARDAIRWCVVKGADRKSRQITCKPFAERLFSMMDWDAEFRYRFQGMRIKYYQDEMYLFDLSADERFAPMKKDENGVEEVVGEPTEAALVAYSSIQNLPKSDLVKFFPRVGEAPFDSGRKMMSTVHENIEKDAPAGLDTELDKMVAASPYVQFTKGAPDVVLRHCTRILTDHGVVPITDELAANVKRDNARMAGKALRVLSLAMRVYDKEPADYSDAALEQDLIFVGLVGMIDPIRPEVKAAVAECRQAGIRPIMITGDQLDTAVAIGKDLGMIDSADDAILGSALDDMSDEELLAKVATYSVYARVQPEHKVRIVKAWRARQMVTAMTGDGVNDAPAIKTADIGVGMGITGTDVTKNVSDMILADDNFATIVAAVEEGRRIYSNIRKCIQFLLATNISEVMSILVATILGFTVLKPAHLLWINLITDSLPALALGMEHAEGDSMKERPRSAREGVFAGGMDKDIIYQGAVTTLLVLTAYFIGEYLEAGQWHIAASNDGITMAFLTMSMCEIFHSFNMRSRRKSIFTLTKQNLWLWGSGIAALILTTAVIEIPALARIFEFTTIDAKEYGIAMGLAILIIPIVEIIKAVQRAVENNQKTKREESERRAKKRA